MQYAYNVFSEKYAVRALLEAQDLGGIARSPLAMGMLTGKMTSETTFPEDDVRQQLDFTEGRHAFLLGFADRVREVLTVGGHTPAQGALAWVVGSDPNTVAIPGCRTVAQVEENMTALERGPLGMDQLVELEGLRAAHLDTVRNHYAPSEEEESTD